MDQGPDLIAVEGSSLTEPLSYDAAAADVAADVAPCTSRWRMATEEATRPRQLPLLPNAEAAAEEVRVCNEKSTSIMCSLSATANLILYRDLNRSTPAVAPFIGMSRARDRPPTQVDTSESMLQRTYE